VISVQNRLEAGPIRKLAAAFAVTALVTVVAAGLATELLHDPELHRALLAGVVAVAVIVVSSRRPRAGVLLTFAFLVVLALIRRLLIPIAGWTSLDPLLLVGPVVSIFLLVGLFVVEKRSLAPDRLSKLVLAMLLLTFAESLNPVGGKFPIGLVGLIFLAAPLFWFFIGREIADRRIVVALLVAIVISAVGIALYGIWQTAVELPSWDATWVDLNGYSALQVQKIRAFATFSSSAEYATYLAIALALAIAVFMYRRRSALLAVLVAPLLGWALFIESSRGIVVAVVLCLAVLATLRLREDPLVGVVALIGVIGIYLTLLLFGPMFETMALGAGDPLVIHQVSGLVSPLDPAKSTLPQHWDLIVVAFNETLQYPLGVGTVATNIIGARSGVHLSGTEVDLLDAFVELGLAGGVLFTLVVLGVMRRIVGLYLRTPDLLLFALIGVLVVTLGQWLNGGYYAVAPLVWFLIGWICREWNRSVAESGKAVEPG
jgi:hypothetical protein